MPGRPRPIVVVITVISVTNGVVCVTGGGGNDGKDVNLGNFPLWKNDFLPSRFCNGDKTENSSFFGREYDYTNLFRAFGLSVIVKTLLAWIGQKRFMLSNAEQHYCRLCAINLSVNISRMMKGVRFVRFVI